MEFTLFAVDYQMNRGNSLYQQAAYNSAVSNGWVEYESPDAVWEQSAPIC